MKTYLIILPYLYNFIFLLNRKKKFFNDYKKWIVVLIYASIGIFFYLYNTDKNIDFQNLLFYWSFLTPLIFTLYIYISTKISFKILNRDFKLYLRFSSEIDYINIKKNKNIKFIDKIISYSCLILIMVLPFLILFF
jgi:hypothetical protein